MSYKDIHEMYFPQWVKNEWEEIIAHMEVFSSTPEGRQFLLENDPRLAIVMRDQNIGWPRDIMRMEDPQEKVKSLPEGLQREWNVILDHMEEFVGAMAAQWFLRENDPRQAVKGLK